jgi:hypothetical protein
MEQELDLARISKDLVTSVWRIQMDSTRMESSCNSGLVLKMESRTCHGKSTRMARSVGRVTTSMS